MHDRRCRPVRSLGVSLVRNALLIVAALLISVGTALWVIDAGLIVAGVLLGAFVLLSD